MNSTSLEKFGRKIFKTYDCFDTRATVKMPVVENIWLASIKSPTGRFMRDASVQTKGE